MKESVKAQIEYAALCGQYAAEDVDALVELSTAAHCAVHLAVDRLDWFCYKD